MVKHCETCGEPRDSIICDCANKTAPEDKIVFALGIIIAACVVGLIGFLTWVLIIW